MTRSAPLHSAPPSSSGTPPTATMGFLVQSPRTPKPVKSPRFGRRLNTSWWFFRIQGESTERRVQAPSRTLEAVGNPPHAHHLNTHADGPAARAAADPALLAW